jgi:hypothetical protein
VIEMPETATAQLHARHGLRWWRAKGQNAWALFDAAGYSYNIRGPVGYWPHTDLTPMAFRSGVAAGMPSGGQAGLVYAASVPLRTDLACTDGSFTAEDVAFTVNTALAFRLG